MRILLWMSLFLCTNAIWAQVKVGDNINTIDAASILELESTNKAFVITRMNTAQMNAITPLNGALIYNTDEKCVFVFEGAVWKSVCDAEISVTTSATAPVGSLPGDIWFNTSDNSVSIWDGTTWNPIPKSTLNGSGPPNLTTAPNPFSGDIYVDNVSGDLYTYNGTNWVPQTITAANGITKTAANTIELGGALSKPTAIGTDAVNTISINGLEEVIDNTQSVVTVKETTGVLQKTPISAFLQQEEIVIIATDAQTQFTPPLTITSPKKLNVYRNGVKLGFTVIDDTTIELETPVFCYQNDEIRIVQFH